MGEEPEKINESEKKDLVNKAEEKNNSNMSKPWDEARVVVFLIGICLLIEGLLIYYQAGASQVLVSSVTGLGGVVMMLMAWLLPFDIDELEELDESIEIIENKKEEIKAPTEEPKLADSEKQMEHLKIAPPESKVEADKEKVEKEV